MIYLAHTGHWLISLVYVVPVLVLVVSLSVNSLRERRRERRGEGPRGRRSAGLRGLGDPAPVGLSGAPLIGAGDRPYDPSGPGWCNRSTQRS